MHKVRRLFISILTFPFLLTGCDIPEGPYVDQPCVNHVDSNNDGLCDICKEEMPEGTQNFQGLSFSNKTFTYDGKEHSIYVDGVPDFANVSYTGNNQKDVGKYKVTAKVKAEGYNTKTLTAYLTITGNTFEGITFKDQTFEWDGKTHSIEVTGAPDFATVTYSGNNKKDIGKHKVTATISAEGYTTKTLSAYLTIKGKQFTGITFKNQEIPYDGYYHSIYVEGAPSGATVTYEGNNKKEVGSYTVNATIKKEGFETLSLSATMKISKTLPLIESLVDKTILYTGFYQPVVFSFPENMRYGVTAVYKVDGKTVDEDTFGVKDVGTHTVSITLKDSYYEECADRTTTAKITVIKETVGSVDSTKSAFVINDNTTYKQLRAEILKGNFTIKYEYFDDFDRDKDGIYEESNLSICEMIYVANGELFSFMAYQEDYSKYNEYKHAKIVNNEVLVATFENGILEGDYSGKMPKSAWEENFVSQKGLAVIAYLNEGTDGKFANGEVGGYTTTYGTFSINSSKNTFQEDYNDYYFHTEWNHAEHGRYTIYNIGNTKINMVDNYNVEKLKYSSLENMAYLDNGITYYLTNDGKAYQAYLDFDPASLCYLEPKEYIIPAVYNGLPVTEYNQSYYYPYFYDETKMVGFTFKVYFNSSGNYQGEYEDLGYLKNYRCIWNIEYDGATILCYDDWH